MTIKEEIIMNLQASKVAKTASELAKDLERSKSEINSILYSMEDKVLSKSNTTPPFWSIIPLEKQIVKSLLDCGEEGRTAIELSEELCIPKSDINSILYQFEGKLFRKNGDYRPKWFNC